MHILDKCLKANNKGMARQTPVIMQCWPAEVCDGAVVAEKNRMAHRQDAGRLPWRHAQSRVDLEPVSFLVANTISHVTFEKRAKQDHRWRPKPRKQYENGLFDG